MQFVGAAAAVLVGDDVAHLPAITGRRAERVCGQDAGETRFQRAVAWAKIEAKTGTIADRCDGEGIDGGAASLATGVFQVNGQLAPDGRAHLRAVGFDEELASITCEHVAQLTLDGDVYVIAPTILVPHRQANVIRTLVQIDQERAVLGGIEIAREINAVVRAIFARSQDDLVTTRGNA